MLASRTNWKFSPNRLTLRLKTLRESGVQIFDLSESNPTRCQFEYLNSMLLSPLLNPKNLSYEPNPKGTLEARRVIQNYYQEKNIHVDPEQIFITSSTSEAYSLLFRLFVNPSEHVLIPHPSYPLFDFLADLNDIQLDSYRLAYDGVWHIDLESLRMACDSKTKAIVLVHPNNPTGSFVKKKELDEIAKLAYEKSIILISDEVFSDYSFLEDSERAPSFAVNQDALTFTLGGISKSLGLPQMKLGWIVATGLKELLRSSCERLEVVLDTYLSVNTPVQNALPSWFSMKKIIQNEIRNRIKKNLAFLTSRLFNSHPANCLKTEGGWYATLRIPKTLSEEEWVLEVLEKDHVYLHPGYFFDFEDEAYIIISLLPSPEIFNEAVSRILARIKNQ